MADAEEDSGAASQLVAFRELVAKAQHLTREKFVAENPHPVLLQLGSDHTPIDTKGIAKTVAGFQTVIPGVTSQATAPRPMRVIPLVKRPGANAFSHMITVGRAKNNDVVLAEVAVSKFHMSFTQRDGVWHVTDSSTHGTWVGAVKLEKGQATKIDSGATLSLARAVTMRFLEPADLFAYLITGQLA